MGSYFDLVEFKELLVPLDDCSSGLSGLGDDFEILVGVFASGSFRWLSMPDKVGLPILKLFDGEIFSSVMKTTPKKEAIELFSYLIENQWLKKVTLG